MKSTIAKCLQDMVKENHGEDTWRGVLEAVGLSPYTLYMSAGNVEDSVVRDLFTASAHVIGVPTQSVMWDFGVYWSNVYAPRVYEVFYSKYTSARGLLEALSEIHAIVVRSIPNAKPPHFDITEEGPDVISMRYQSERNLINLMPGLIHGVGLHFGEDVRATLRGDCVRVEFHGARDEPVKEAS